MGEQHWSLSSMVRWAGSVVLAVLFALSFSGYVVTKVVTGSLANSQFYTNAFRSNEIYRRVYSDLLADPALRDVTRQLLGGLRVEPQAADAVYGHAVSTLHLVLPPEELQRAVEDMIAELIAYLSGERDRFDATLDFSAVLEDERLLDHVMTAVQAVESQFIAQTTVSGELLPRDDEGRIAVDLNVLVSALDSHLDALAEGRLEALPPWINEVETSQLSEADRQRIIAVMMSAPGLDDSVESGVDGLTRAEFQMQIEGALANDDLPGAIIIAARVFANVHARDVIATLRSELDGGQLSGVTALATLADQTTGDLIAELNNLRDLVSYVRGDLMPLIVLVMFASLVGLMTLQGRQWRRIWRMTAVALISAGMTVLAAWTILGPAAGIPFAQLLADSSGGSLPPSLNRMLDDILNALLDSLREAVVLRAMVPLMIGLALLGLSSIRTVAVRTWRVLEPLHRRPRAVVVVVALVIVFGPVVADWWQESEQEVSAEYIRCNGHTDLCNRRLDEVAFAATHNAMSISLYGWMWPEHDGTFTDQLEAGVRAMLIDTYSGDTPERIEAFLESAPSTTRPLLETIIAAADPAVKREGMFLCHNLCSLGATPLVDGLAEIRTFMEKNPHEVIVLIIEDSLSPQDTVHAFEESGLIRYVYTHRTGSEWPILGEMIEQGRRLVVLAEQGGPPPAWYHHAWDVVQETSFAFTHPDELSCIPNRGVPDAPFFLLNHWITFQSPDRVDATVINAYDFLLARAQQCADERGQMPNFIAVNFYSIGDVFAVVDTLNGIYAR